MNKRIKTILGMVVFLGIAYAVMLGVFQLNLQLTNEKEFFIQKKEDRAKLRALNYTKPSSYGGLLASEAINPLQIQIFKRYYTKILETFPSNIHAVEMLGYCAYLEGDLGKAVDLYEQSLKNSPRNFWNYYNLFALYLKTGQFGPAAQTLQLSFGVDTAQSVQTLLMSRIYRQIMDDQQIKPEDLIRRQLQHRAQLMQVVELLKKNISLPQIQSKNLVTLTPQVL